MLPAYMLRQLYAKGSLKNIKEGDKLVGFTFSLKNKLGSATLKGELTIAVDGQAIPPESVTVKKGELTMKISDIMNTPTKFRVGDALDVIIRKDGGLAPGSHKVDMKFSIAEFGKAQFDFSDGVTS